MNVVAVVSRQLSVIIGYYTEHNYTELGRGKSNSYVNCRCRLKMVDCVVQCRDYTLYSDWQILAEVGCAPLPPLSH